MEISEVDLEMQRESFLFNPRYKPKKERKQDLTEKVLGDMYAFFGYLDVIRGTTENPAESRVSRREIEVKYRKMIEIAQNYPGENTLQNKLDEVARAKPYLRSVREKYLRGEK